MGVFQGSGPLVLRSLVAGYGGRVRGFFWSGSQVLQGLGLGVSAPIWSTRENKVHDGLYLAPFFWSRLFGIQRRLYFGPMLTPFGPRFGSTMLAPILTPFSRRNGAKMDTHKWRSILAPCSSGDPSWLLFTSMESKWSLWPKWSQYY